MARFLAFWRDHEHSLPELRAANIEYDMTAMPKRIFELLAERVQLRTGRRVPDLRIEVRDDEIVLLGTVRSFHIKQLALRGAREIVPELRLRNSIAVVS